MTNAPARFTQVDGPMPLEAAVQAFFPRGGATKSTLLAACRKGALAYAKIGNRYLVTQADMQGWIEKCRAKQSLQDTGSGNEKDESPDTSSLIEGEKSTLDAALIMSSELKRFSRNILPHITARTPGNVIRLKSRSRK